MENLEAFFVHHQGTMAKNEGALSPVSRSQGLNRSYVRSSFCIHEAAISRRLAQLRRTVMLDINFPLCNRSIDRSTSTCDALKPIRPGSRSTVPLYPMRLSCRISAVQICRIMRGLGCVTRALARACNSRNLAHIFFCIAVQI